MKSNLRDFIYTNTEAAIKLQRDDGSFPSARSGTRDRTETSVRTTSHWLAILAKLYSKTNDNRLYSAANKAADFLISSEVRPYGYTYKTRDEPGLDFCDGLAGQAAPIRGLVYAGDALDRDELICVASEVFEYHPFDEQLGLWERIEINGENLSFDRTLNHQVMFAMASAKLGIYYPPAEKKVQTFTNKLSNNIAIYKTGLIKHFVNPSIHSYIVDIQENLRYKILLRNTVLLRLYSTLGTLKDTERGYYPTNLRYLSLLKQYHPDSDFWTSKVMSQCLEYRNTDEYLANLNNEVYDYGSEVPRMDHAISCLIFDESTDGFISSINDYISSKYSPEKGLLTKNAVDPMLQAASITYLISFLDENNIEINTATNRQEY